MEFRLFAPPGSDLSFISDLGAQFGLRWLVERTASAVHDPLALRLDTDRQLWLTASGLQMQPAWLEQLYRLKRASQKTEILLRAVQSRTGLTVVDTTAGLGHDALLLATTGAKVTLCERHPVMQVMLAHELSAMSGTVLEKMSGRMQLFAGDSTSFLATHLPDIAYLDPMFPADEKPRRGAPKVKKEMQVLHALYQDQPDDSHLLLPATRAIERVIVKRPRHAPCLSGVVPDHQWEGTACRFDGYFRANRADRMPAVAAAISPV